MSSDTQSLSSLSLIKCPNFLVCGKECPQIVFDYHFGVCPDCNFLFGGWNGGKGVLTYLEDLECCICFEIKICVSQPKCDHFICLDCFKTCYFGKLGAVEPVFPYSDEIKDKYLNSMDDPEWEDDEKISYYLNELEIWYKSTLSSNLTQQYLKCCALCRK